MVGINTADDAGVFLLEAGLALVQTVDLLTPMVEDPRTFGRIAAANSLSDVYAMGGTPLTALNIVGFPGPMDKRILGEILQGGQETVSQAGAVVAGGHTFNEKEIKYGLSVTGQIDPSRIITNAAARVGDQLVLTKPLGTGAFSQLMLSDEEPDQTLYRAATASMMKLNRAAAQAMLACNASSATDITGYGLLGHAQEMAEASRVRIRFQLSNIPFLPGILPIADRFQDPGILMNQTSFGHRVFGLDTLPAAQRNILWESQTSGGLLIALTPEQVDRFCQLMNDSGEPAWLVGQVIPGEPGTVEVVP